ncbi:MAG: SGNH/GDSL hydrolase family protein [Acidimicrobiales bacterium]
MRTLKYALTILVVVALATGMFVLGRASAPSPAGGATPITFSSYYLDIGASESLGVQPTGIPGHNGARTDVGYSNDLVLREALKGVALTLEEIGCGGDTVQALLDTTTRSDVCNQPPTTQLTRARAYLVAHQSDPVLVTVDLGFNDIRPCLQDDPVNETCVDQAITAIQRDLPVILKDLKADAGAQTRFVGLEYSDPFLGYYLDGPSGPARANATLQGMDSFDTVLGRIYTNAGVPVANVPSLFEMNDADLMTLDNIGTVPVNVQEACELTWFCDGAPFGPDDHPNNAGYSLIAQAIEDVLPKSW